MPESTTAGVNDRQGGAYTGTPLERNSYYAAIRVIEIACRANASTNGETADRRIPER